MNGRLQSTDLPANFPTGRTAIVCLKVALAAGITSLSSPFFFRGLRGPASPCGRAIANRRRGASQCGLPPSESP
jgi:hypothetical protein